MTEQELNVFLDLEWNCAAFTPDTEHISAPLSPKQWARIVSRSFRNSVHSPSLPRTSGSSFLKSSSHLHGGVRAGKISPLLNGSVCYDTNRLCSITAKSRIIRLYGVDYWQVAGVMQGISTRMTSRGASCTVPLSC